MCTGREDEKPKGGKVCRSVFKFLVAVSVTAGLAICVYTCFQFYYDFPTYTDISVVNQEEALFPAVTFCPEFPEKIKEEVLRANGITSACEYHQKQCLKPGLNWTPRNQSISPQYLFEMATYSLEDIFSEIIVRYVNSNEDKNNAYRYANYPPFSELKVTDQRKRSHGKCWTISLPHEFTEQPIYYIRYGLKLPVKYYLHKEGQFLNSNGRLGLRYEVGTLQEVQVSAWDIKMLKDDYVNKKCENDLSFDDCLYNALENQMIEATEGNCTVPWTRNNSRICSDQSDVDKAFNISWSRGTNQMGDCQKPCHSLEISLAGSNVVPNPNEKSRLVLFFKNVVTKSEEKRLYQWRNLFAEIGGYVGIFLGYSLLSLGDTIAWAFKKLLQKCNKSENRML